MRNSFEFHYHLERQAVEAEFLRFKKSRLNTFCVKSCAAIMWTIAALVFAFAVFAVTIDAWIDYSQCVKPICGHGTAYRW